MKTCGYINFKSEYTLYMQNNIMVPKANTGTNGTIVPAQVDKMRAELANLNHFLNLFKTRRRQLVLLLYYIVAVQLYYNINNNNIIIIINKY